MIGLTRRLLADVELGIESDVWSSHIHGRRHDCGIKHQTPSHNIANAGVAQCPYPRLLLHLQVASSCCWEPWSTDGAFSHGSAVEPLTPAVPWRSGALIFCWSQPRRHIKIKGFNVPLWLGVAADHGSELWGHTLDLMGPRSWEQQSSNQHSALDSHVLWSWEPQSHS